MLRQGKAAACQGGSAACGKQPPSWLRMNTVAADLLHTLRLYNTAWQRRMLLTLQHTISAAVSRPACECKFLLHMTCNSINLWLELSLSVKASRGTLQHCARRIADSSISLLSATTIELAQQCCVRRELTPLLSLITSMLRMPRACSGLCPRA